MPEERKVGRPTKETRAEERPARIPVNGQRDILTVYNKDPDYSYRWVKDRHENGSRIQKFIAAGYEIVSSDNHRVGENLVYKTNDGGSIIRIPEGDHQHLYLMRQPMEYYNEDFEAKQNRLEEAEKGMFLPDVDEGQYGEVRTERQTRSRANF